MDENKVKKRGWVKNAAIIFLSIMLVLTFFSNTIMNRSLPEVATQAVESGTITEKIRGTGTVTANENYKVTSDVSKTILSIPVKVGDEVKVGDRLVNFQTGDNDELKTAQSELDTQRLAYQKAVINAAGSDYAAERRAIDFAQKDRDKAKAKREEGIVTPDAIKTARDGYNIAKRSYDTQDAVVSGLQEKLDSIGGPVDNSSQKEAAYQDWQAQLSKVKSAKDSLAAVELAHDDAYEAFKAKAAAWKGHTASSIELNALAEKYRVKIDASTTPKTEDKATLDDNDFYPDLQVMKSQLAAYDAITSAQQTLDSAQSKANSLHSAYTSIDRGNTAEYNSAKRKLDEAKTQLRGLKTIMDSAKEKLDDLEAKQSKFEELDNAYETAERALSDRVFELQQKQVEDGKTQQSTALDLQDMKNKLDDQVETVDELKGGSDGPSIDSTVNGIITEVNVSAGNPVEPETELITIDIPDKGYGLSFPITIEQSKKVHVGDEAEIGSYWGPEMTAKIVGIKPSPEEPGKKKMLCFSVEGDEVTAGAQYQVTASQHSQNYDAIIPNSAVRSDSNGSFVLIVTSKSTPLGNRYKATRMDVNVVVKDDVNSAVSGGLTEGDYVITTSTVPIKDGMYVRLPK